MTREARFKRLVELCPDVSEEVVADVVDGYEKRDVVNEGSRTPARLVDVDIVFYNDYGIMFEVDILAKD